MYISDFLNLKMCKNDIDLPIEGLSYIYYAAVHPMIVFE